MKEIYFLFLFYVSTCHGLGLGLTEDPCEDLGATVLVSGYNRNLTLYGAINGSLRLCQGFRVDLNMSWLEHASDSDSLYGIHEVGEFQGVRGGAVGRFDITYFGYQRLEWVSVGAGGIDSLIEGENISLD